APEVVATVPNEQQALLRQLRRLAKSGELRCCYEAGPTGTMLCRALRKEGFACTIVAPPHVPQTRGDRIKTDRRDALRLARFLRSGDLVEVHLLDEESEALRDLVRTRDQAKRSERQARLQLKSFLLRQGQLWKGKGSWSQAHFAWIRSLQFQHEAHQRVLVALVTGLELAIDRVKQLTRDIHDIAPHCAIWPSIRALQALRGIDLLHATLLMSEVGDFARFPSAPAFMAYVGLVPSENSSGQTRRRGAITRTGNSFVRTAFVEAAWAYRHRPGNTPRITSRQKGLSDQVRLLAWKAQLRLCGRFRSLCGRGKNKQQVVTAIARELAGFVWAIAREPKLLAA
ncbi:MAG TPA: IS110 family transposase, partial [Polyangiaceae bacterium]|nr:IS110 family transposase [Polyangiaceae bacterium]